MIHSDTIGFMRHVLITGDVVRARSSVVAHMWRTEKDKRLMAVSDQLTSGGNAEMVGNWMELD